MARQDKLYDNPRSKPRGQQKADRGDKRDIDGEEYESLGYIKKIKEPAESEGDFETDMTEEGKKSPFEPGEKTLQRAKGGIEFWRKKKAERPMS